MCPNPSPCPLPTLTHPPAGKQQAAQLASDKEQLQAKAEAAAAAAKAQEKACADAQPADPLAGPPEGYVERRLAVHLEELRAICPDWRYTSCQGRDKSNWSDAGATQACCHAAAAGQWSYFKLRTFNASGTAIAEGGWAAGRQEPGPNRALAAVLRACSLVLGTTGGEARVACSVQLGPGRQYSLHQKPVPRGCSHIWVGGCTRRAPCWRLKPRLAPACLQAATPGMSSCTISQLAALWWRGCSMRATAPT